MKLEINVAQSAEGAVGADFGGSDGAFENGGDFGEGVALEATEEENLPVIPIEFIQSMTEEFAIIAGGRTDVGEGPIIGVVMKIGGIGGGGGFVGFAEMIGGAASREMIHPRGEFAVVAIGVAVFEHALKDDLSDVFGGGAIPGEFCEEAEKWAVVFLKKFAERIEVALAHGEHQLVVGLGSGRFQGRSAVGVSRGQSGGHTKI